MERLFRHSVTDSDGSAVDKILHSRIAAFVCVALGAMVQVVSDRLGIASGSVWIKTVSWAVVGVGILLWTYSKSLQKRAHKRTQTMFHEDSTGKSD